MERESSSSTTTPRSSEEDQTGRGGGCGRSLKMKVPIEQLWRKSRNYIRQQSSKSSCTSSVCVATASRISICGNQHPKKPKFNGAGFRYDPLSYAQNFDEGSIGFDNQDDYAHVNFSSRFAALPAAKSTGQSMPKYGCAPNSFSYNPLLHAFCKDCKMQRAIEYLGMMVSGGCHPDIVTYATLLTGMVYHGGIPDIISCRSSIQGLCKVGNTRKATRVLEILEESGAVPDVDRNQEILIGGYCKAGEIDNALRLLDRMSVAPDVVTYSTILHCLCGSGKWKQAMEVLDRQFQSEGCPNVITYTILVEAACK
ncbi:hypothetical protein Cgig2_026556 [Carnegiea gigantea]|uniref:Pentatricopeptide repeat-containing protein n=1 Tax=Carnegiea gigantea TaxID=171969 RepID=A0A9Q1KGU0_9CARY|nr:hypothetical protein Cgig2_026556 [Carnegiea gigantea]